MLVTGNNIAIPQDIHIPDPSFSSATAHNYKLLVDIGATAVSYATYRPTDDSISALQSILLSSGLNAVKALEDSGITKFKFQQVVLGFELDEFSLIPKALFNLAELHTYGKFQFGDIGIKRMYYNELADLDFTAIYAQLPGKRNSITELFDNPVITTRPLALINSLLKTNTDQVMAYLQSNGTLLLASTRNGKLEAANLYPVATTDDCIYFLHAFTEALQINKAVVPLISLSDTEALQQQLAGINTYFKQHNNFKSNTFGKLTEPIAEVQQFFNPLLSLKLCV